MSALKRARSVVRARGEILALMRLVEETQPLLYRAFAKPGQEITLLTGDSSASCVCRSDAGAEP
jgi:hypothetical protein